MDQGMSSAPRQRGGQQLPHPLLLLYKPPHTPPTPSLTLGREGNSQLDSALQGHPLYVYPPIQGTPSCQVYKK